LLARVSGRTKDASDADSEIVRTQAKFNTGKMEWSQVKAEGSKNEVFVEISTILAS
jgi:predicted kinase